MGKKKTLAREATATARPSDAEAKEGLGQAEGSNPPADFFSIPNPGCISPAFGFVFARRENGMTALLRIVTDEGGAVLELKEVRVGQTRTILNVMVHELRKLVADGTFRTGEIAGLAPEAEAEAA